MSDGASERPDHPDIEASLGKIYGGWAMRELHTLQQQHPDAPIETLAETIKQRPTPTVTFFFRDENLTIFATEVAPHMAHAVGKRPLRIGQVACSRGDETWSLAALLETQGVPYEITATDINPEVLAEAKAGVYPETSMSNMYTRRSPEGKATKHFKHDRHKGTFEPNSTIRERVTFTEHDILDGPLPGGPYDALFANNILYHYPEGTRDLIIKNITGSLAVGGVLVFDDSDAPGYGAYKTWASDMEGTAGLAPFTPAGDYQTQIRQYDPSKKIHAARLPEEALSGIISSAGDGLMAQLGAAIAQAVCMLPGDAIEKTLDAILEAADTLQLTVQSSNGLTDEQDQLFKTVMRAQEIVATLHGSSHHLRTYLGDIGITNGYTSGQ